MTLLCDQPQDDHPALPCMDTAVYGTSRCLRHQAPRGRVTLRTALPVGDGDTLLGEQPKPVGWTACGCRSCPELPELTPQPETVQSGAENERPAALLPGESRFLLGRDEPPAVELLAMADDLNAHGGLDEKFVAELLRQAVADEPLDAAYAALGVPRPLVEPTPPLTTAAEPITYETIIAALEKVAPLGPQRLDVVKLTQEQIDAVTASQPHAAPSVEPWHYFGTPVEIVDTVEESTPYQLANAQPSGIIEIHGHLTEPEFERLRTDWRAVDAKPVLPRWLVEADREFVAHVNDGVDRGAVLDAIKAAAAPNDPPDCSAGRHIWSTTSPMRCVECRRYLTPWWRRALDRVRRWGR